MSLGQQQMLQQFQAGAEQFPTMAATAVPPRLAGAPLEAARLAQQNPQASAAVTHSLLRAVGAPPEPKPKPAFGDPQKVITGAGAVMLLILCCNPICSSISMLLNDNFVFWIGRNVPVLILATMLTIIALWVFTVRNFFQRSHPQFKTEQTVLMIIFSFVSLLGLGFVLTGFPLMGASATAYKDIRTNCATSALANGLLQEYEALLKLRLTSTCATKMSVRDCAGFVGVPPYSDFLEAVERDMHCSGFCYQGSQAQAVANGALVQQPAPAPAAIPAPAPTPAPAAALLAQHAALVPAARHCPGGCPMEQVGRLRRASSSNNSSAVAAERVSLLEVASRSSAEAHMAGPDTATEQTGQITYPPTLFSLTNDQVSCEGMMARDISRVGEKLGTMMFYEGLCLLVTAVVLGFLKLVDMCRQDVWQSNKAVTM